RGPPAKCGGRPPAFCGGRVRGFAGGQGPFLITITFFSFLLLLIRSTPFGSAVQRRRVEVAANGKDREPECREGWEAKSPTTGRGGGVSGSDTHELDRGSDTTFGENLASGHGALVHGRPFEGEECNGNADLENTAAVQFDTRRHTSGAATVGKGALD